jgi:hypothetical protein
MKRAKKHPAPAPPAPRNPVARSPLLGKGGPHGKSEAALRREAKMALARIKRDPESLQ